MHDTMRYGKADWAETERAIRVYAEARGVFRKAQKKYSQLLGGNDNKVGVCGEYWVKRRYLKRGYQIVEVPASNNRGWDFRCARRGSKLRVSVKVVSDESLTGLQMPMKEGAAWDELALVQLDDHLCSYRFGIVTRRQYERAQREGRIGRKPRVSRGWLGGRGWICKYGNVENGKL